MWGKWGKCVCECLFYKNVKEKDFINVGIQTKCIFFDESSTIIKRWCKFNSVFTKTLEKNHMAEFCILGYIFQGAVFDLP